MTLPNFIMIGVAKAGTTSYFRYLDQHPQIYMCPIKGSNYFGYQDALDWKWSDEGEPPLLRHFQVTTFEDFENLFSGATGEIAIGEVSPQYFRCPTAARRIQESIPDVKLIASIRNPADRAFSGFMMRTRRGEAVKSIRKELTPDSSHVKEGFYYQRMKRFFDIFPRESIKVYIFEEFKKDPTKILKDLYNFLGVDTGYVPDTSVRHNPGAVPKYRLLNRLFYDPKIIQTAKRFLPENFQAKAKQTRQMNLKSSPKLPQEVRADLLNIYHDDILQLESLIHQDLTIWLNGDSSNAKR
ncbi:MAG: sulfotransferase [Chloroflexota bacterium]|nr:MAG: sulfotransferase [Chloroflexota bacterium]